MIKHQMFIAAALLAGVAIGYFVKDETVPGAVPQATNAVHRADGAIADKGAEASLKALRRRVAQLEAALAEKDEKAEAAISNAVAAAAKPPAPPQMNWRERMEEMKKNDPARYAQMTNRFAQWRRSRAEQARTKIDFLSSVDTTRMSAGARKTHTALQDLIVRREEIEIELQQEDLSDEERGKLWGELRSTHGEYQRLSGEERRNLFDETAKNLGFEGQDVKDFTTAVQEVIRATDSGWGGGHHGGHHGGPRGR